MTFPSMPTRRRANGFTLVELMISLALVLLLTVAMARIFGVTTRAISKGTAVGEVVRGLDATSKALQIDLAGTQSGVGYDPYRKPAGVLPLSEQPAIIISSKTYNTFLNEADRKADADKNPATLDVDGDGDDAGANDATLSNFQTGRRWFRGDRFSFFARGDFKSQANGSLETTSAFQSNVTSPEAWVWYGHGRVYNGQGNLNASAQYKDPGKAGPDVNANNYYASDWILLRNATLLKSPVDHDGTSSNEDTVVDDGGNPILHQTVQRSTGGTSTPWRVNNPRDPNTLAITTTANSSANVSPLIYGNPVWYFPPANNGNATAKNGPVTGSPYESEYSRTDVAGVSSNAFRQHLDAIQSAYTAAGTTFNAGFYPTPRRTWYDQLFATEVAANGPPSGTNPLPYSNTEYRYWVNPQLLSPLNAGETSQATSPLLPGCTGFVVEYAGDFLAQNANGTLATGAANGGLSSDGVIDFNVDAGGVPHTRWYGLPRDVDGNGFIPGPGVAENARIQTFDTLPLADYAGALYPFERRVPGPVNATGPTNRNFGDYVALKVGSPNSAGGNNPMTPGNAGYVPGTADSCYVVAWGPGDFDGTAYIPGGPYANFAGQKFGPSLIRIVVTAVDNQNKLEESITQELVFRVPAK